MVDESLYIDDLTGVYNRRYLKDQQERAAMEMIANSTPFSVVMVDIDHFKEINDTYGHMKGDEVIKDFAQFLIRSRSFTESRSVNSCPRSWIQSRIK
jgi:diguanylate cyclase (GGDEF)-like protein